MVLVGVGLIWFGVSSIHLMDRTGQLLNSGSFLPVLPAPHRSDGHGGGSARGAEHLVLGGGDRTVCVWGVSGLEGQRAIASTIAKEFNLESIKPTRK